MVKVVLEMNIIAGVEGGFIKMPVKMCHMLVLNSYDGSILLIRKCLSGTMISVRYYGIQEK